jgi:hypothetical protein
MGEEEAAEEPQAVDFSGGVTLPPLGVLFGEGGS